MNFLIIIFLTTVCGTMVGLFFFKRQKARLDYFDELVELINKLILDVRFRQDKLSVVMTEFAKDCKSQLKEHISIYMENKGQAWELTKLNLKKNELSKVTKFFDSLGKTDANTQLMELDAYKAEFDSDLKKAKQHNEKFGTVYLKLGFALGIGVGILFV